MVPCKVEVKMRCLGIRIYRSRIPSVTKWTLLSKIINSFVKYFYLYDV